MKLKKYLSVKSNGSTRVLVTTETINNMKQMISDSLGIELKIKVNEEIE